MTTNSQAVGNVVASVAAGMLTEVVAAAVAKAVIDGQFMSIELLAAAIGFGFGIGLAFGAAELVTRRRGRLLGITTAAVASLCAPLGSLYALEWLRDWNTIAAGGRVANGLLSQAPSSYGLFALGVGLVYGPLLHARLRGAGIIGEAGSMCAGATACVVSLLVLPPERMELTVHTLVLVLASHCAAFPVSLRACRHLVTTAAAYFDPGRSAGRTMSADACPTQPDTRDCNARAVVALFILLALVFTTSLVSDLPVEVVRARLWSPLLGPTRLFEAGQALMGRSTGGVATIWPVSRFLSTGRSPGAPRYRVREANRLYRLAANRGHLPAMLAYAEVLGRGMRSLEAEDQAPEPPTLEERAECVSWLRQAAELGNDEAALELGERLVRGWYDSLERRPVGPLLAAKTVTSAAEDAQEGVRWLERAANKGSERAVRCLIAAYQYSRGPLPPDELKAIAWCRRLAPRDVDVRLDLHHLLLRHLELRGPDDDRWLADMPTGYDTGAPSADCRLIVLSVPPPLAGDALSDAILSLYRAGLDSVVRVLAECRLMREPQSAFYNNIMALVYLRMGLAQRNLRQSIVQVAEGYLGRAFKGDPDDPTTAANLAACSAYGALMRAEEGP